MDDDPHQLWLYLLHNILGSIYFELAGKAFLLLALLGLSGFIAGVESLLESTPEKEETSASKTLRNLPNIKGSLVIIRVLVKTAIAITAVEVFRQVFGIENIHILYVLFFIAIASLLVFGQWVSFFVPVNKKYEASPFLQNFLLFTASIMTPLVKILALDKKFAKRTLKKKGYYKEKKHLMVNERSFEKIAAAFNHTTVKQIMRYRMDITAFNLDMDFQELLNNLNKFGFSRIPVYRETIDKIEGIFYLKDIIPYIGRGKNFTWQNLIRPPYFVPENKKIEELLREFQEKHIHMALVVDDYGGISGLVTLEDILEEIVGEINDELDEVDLNYVKIDDTTYIFEGKTSMRDFCKAIGIETEIFEEAQGENQSLGGFLLQLNSNLPKKGDKIYFKNFVFRIDSANNKRIKKVKIEILEEKEVNEDAEI